MKNQKLTRLFPILFCLAAANVAGAQGPGGPPPPPEVAIITMEPQTVPVSFDYVGTAEASKVVEIRSRVQGFLESRDFEEGAFVKKGDLLFTIDARPFEASLDIATARVEQAETRLKLAEQEVRRLQSVNVPGAIAESDLDRQLAEQSDAAASLRLAQAQRDLAELELSYTKVYAPLNGYVGKTEKEIGSLVDAAQNSLLTTLRQVDPIYVSFQVSEREYLALREQEAAGVYVLAEGAEPYLEITFLDGIEYGAQGLLNFESVTVDLLTSSVEMRGEFPNGEYAIKPGQFVKVHMKGWSRPNSLLIPQRAVSQSPQGAFVYVIGADNKAELRPIEPGQWVGQDWIIERGLAAGDRVVVEGLVKVQPGIEVNPAPYDPNAQANIQPQVEQAK